jgi:acyl carrier protein
MYRTGDLARRRGDDELAYLGRSDHQVKLRGFRIELGEIESVLRAHQAVRDAVVVADASGPAGPRLVAYVVAENTPGLPFALADHCARKLPRFMLPAVYTALPDLPRTPNGKTDRRALPVASPHGHGQTEYVAPAHALEHQVAVVWSELLGIERVGARDDFFALGGHSLLATQLVARLRSEFGVALPLRAVFETPTVAGLAAALVAEQPDGADVMTYAQLRQHIDSLSPDEIMARLDDV